MLLPLQGATAPTRDTQGVAALALGWVLHWAFSPHLQYTSTTSQLAKGKANYFGSFYPNFLRNPYPELALLLNANTKR